MSCLRLAISAAMFLPWLAARRLPRVVIVRAAVIGAVQFGLMYACYIAAYAWLPAYLVAVMTIFTPLYVVAIVDAGRRRWSWRHAGGAALAVAGAAVVVAREADLAHAWPGILLLQVANLCFAAGQVAYRRLLGGGRGPAARPAPWPETAVTAWMYAGATLVTGLATLLVGDPRPGTLDREAWLVLAYLGLVPTGLGFHLWNRGAARARAGVLAVANNLKIPLGVLVAWTVFGESAPYARVLAGLAVILAALIWMQGEPVAGAGGAARTGRVAG